MRSRRSPVQALHTINLNPDMFLQQPSPSHPSHMATIALHRRCWDLPKPRPSPSRQLTGRMKTSQEQGQKKTIQLQQRDHNMIRYTSQGRRQDIQQRGSFSISRGGMSCWVKRDDMDPYTQQQYTYVKHKRKDRWMQTQKETKIRQPSNITRSYRVTTMQLARPSSRNTPTVSRPNQSPSIAPSRPTPLLMETSRPSPWDYNPEESRQMFSPRH